MTRAVVANLDAELELAGTGALPLSPSARATAASLGTLLRVFAADGDDLWTVAPVSPVVMPRVAGIATPRLRAGAIDGFATYDAILPWCQTAAIPRRPARRAIPRAADPDEADLVLRIWALPRPRPGVVAAVHHRAFAWETARELGCALEGSRMVESVDDLQRHLASGAAAAGDDGRFVLKAPLSASGRDRVVLRAGDLDGPAARARVERLFRAFRQLLFEPWMKRTKDLAALGLVDDDGVTVIGVHELEVEPEGRFSGIIVSRGRTLAERVPAFARVLLESTAREVGERLREREYRGPFGVDGWIDVRDGRETLHPLGEINARLTMGFVARAFCDRLGSGRDDGAAALRLGRVLPEPSAVTALLAPAADAPVAAWFDPDVRATR